MNTVQITICSIVLVLILVLFGSQGVRGTDQYWYVADTQSLIEGDMSQTTNMYFPGKLLREGDSPTPNFYMHNGFALKIAAFIGDRFGAYHGWIIMNTLMHFIAAVCVFISCIYFVKPVVSAWITTFYLLTPIAIWQTVNPLLEQSYAVMCALFVVGYIYHSRFTGLLVLLLAIALGVPSHPIFLPPAIAIILMFGLRILTTPSKISFAGFVSSMLVLVCAYFWGKNYLPSSFQPDLQAIVTSAIPGKSNMFWHYSFDQHSITADLMLLKLKTGLERHFFTLKLAPFYVFTNIALVLGLWLLFFRFKKLFWLILPACIFYGLYFSMIFLQQNHPRYQHIIAPVTFTIIAIFISEVKIKVASVMKITALSCVVSVNVLMLNTIRTESRMEAEDLAKLKERLSAVENIDSLVTFDVMPHNPISYMIRPTPLLAIRTDMLTEDQIIESLDRFRPSHILSEFEIPEDFANIGTLELLELSSELFGTLYLYSSRY